MQSFTRGNKVMDTFDLWRSMTKEEIQPWNELATQIKELREVKFLAFHSRGSLRLTSLTPAVMGLVLIVEHLHSAEHFIDQINLARNMSVVHPFEEYVLLRPTPCWIPGHVALLRSDASTFKSLAEVARLSKSLSRQTPHLPKAPPRALLK
jgi:hypothetical protein